MNTEEKQFKVAAIQMTSVNHKETNLKKAGGFISRAAKEGAKIVALPEMFSFSGTLKEKRVNAESIPGPTINRLSRMAKNLQIYLLGGSILEKPNDKDNGLFYNTSVFFNPQGKIIARYRKLHLFDVALPNGSSRRESELITPGDEVIQVTTPLTTFGLSICYDLRFPELYRRLAQEGTQVVFIPSAFTLETGKDHWKTLLRARAIENQFYVIAPDQIGPDLQGQRCWGKSMIVDPWGTILAQAPEKETIIYAPIDLSYQQKIRETLPCLSHRRNDLFSI